MGKQIVWSSQQIFTTEFFVVNFENIVSAILKI